MPRAIVAGHGSFPAGMVSAVTQITGRGDVLLPFSNNGLGREEIESGLRDQVTQHAIGVIFTDLPGGSATIAARRLLREYPTLVLVTGTNLAALLDFVFSETLSPADAAHHAADKGRGALAVVET